ncbi:hypothetical protein GCM10023353_10820 [Tomitella cavernea]|uniref:Type II toxin-antitoxin system VapC family toxin n=1 Tax=Tomitella cavernea TaxID=1387982 RepID=A0ABP9CIK0_9ACTN
MVRWLDAQSVRAVSRAAGAAVGDLDAMIAAIAVTRSASIATRDTAPFLAAGIPVTDPFVAVD